MRKELTVPSQDLPSAIRWEQLRAQVLSDWGRKGESLEALSRATGHWNRFQQEQAEAGQ